MSDPFMAYGFSVEVEGLAVGGFSSIRGLSSKIEVRSVREGGVNDKEYKLGGPVTYGDLTFESGLLVSDVLWDWYEDAANGTIKRKNGTIYLLDSGRQPHRRWDFFNAWPIDWQGPTLDAGQSLVATQRFVLTHEGLKKVGVGR